MENPRLLAPLIEVLESSRQRKALDKSVLYVIVFPNFFSDDPQVSKELSVIVDKTWCYEVYFETFKTIEEESKDAELQVVNNLSFSSPAKGKNLNMAERVKSNWEGFDSDNGEKVELRKFLRMIVTVVIKVMEIELGLDLNLFFSVDKDEIFMTVKCSENNLQVQASLMEYKVQLNEVNAPGKIPDYRRVPPYGEFDPKLIQKGKTNVYKKYDTKGKWIKDRDSVAYTENFSYFTYTDKVQILLAMINSEIDTGVLQENNIILCHFPLNDENLDELRENWGNFAMFWKPQNLNKVRNYFGEKIAMYFAWLEYYIIWLIFPGVLGVIVFVFQHFYGDIMTKGGRMSVSDILLLLFSCILAMGSTVLHQVWIRRQSELSWMWGTTHIHEIEVQRPRFKGSYGKDPISGQKKKLPSQRFKTYLKRVLGFTISIKFVLLTICIISTLMFYKVTIDSLAANYGIKLCAIVNAFQIKIMNFIYRRIARKLNDWENYEYDSESNDNLAIKLYLFQFINSYSSLFYIAFFKSWLEQKCQSSCSGTGADCRLSCMDELKVQLGTIFLINMCMNVIELGLPYLRSRISKYNEKKRLKEMELRGDVINKKTSEYEKQRKLEEYETPLDDYMEIIIDYGYVTMFSTAFPPVAVLALLVNIFEVRVDAFKLCYLTRRPYPAPANSIGEWERVIGIVSILGTLTNTGIIVFTSDIFHLNTYREKMLYFLVIEHILILFKIVLARIIPDVPTKVKDGLVWQNRVSRERIFNKVSDVDEQRHRFDLFFAKQDQREVVLDPEYIENSKPPLDYN